MPTVVMDACALIAFLENEPGAEVVEDYLSDLTVDCVVHSLNLCEVYYNVLRDNGQTVADEAIESLKTNGIRVVTDMSESFWRRMAELKVSPGRLSICDCAAIVLAEDLQSPLVTCDHHEFDRVDALGIVPFVFIR